MGNGEITQEEMETVSKLVSQLSGSMTLDYFARIAGLPEDRLKTVLYTLGSSLLVRS